MLIKLIEQWLTDNDILFLQLGAYGVNSKDDRGVILELSVRCWKCICSACPSSVQISTTLTHVDIRYHTTDRGYYNKTLPAADPSLFEKLLDVMCFCQHIYSPTTFKQRYGYEA